MNTQSVRNFILSQKCRTKKAKKGEGILYFGMFILLTMFILVTFIVKKWMINATLERVEDNLTMSALGSMLYDVGELSIKGNIVLDDTSGNVNSSYHLLCDLLAKNLGLEKVSTTECWKFKGTSPYFAPADGNNCYIERAIFYNVRKDSIKIYTYEKSGTVTKTQTVNPATTTVIAPTGDTVTATSVYLFFHYPQDYYEKTIDVKKAVLVGMDDT